MRAVVQRVAQASVTVEGECVGEISDGILVYLGVESGDTSVDVGYFAGKLPELRIFPDDDGKMNRSLRETGGAILLVSQFTLLGDCRKGRRPSFVQAADPELGERLYDELCQRLREFGIRVQTGRFRTDMDVASVNRGPVTLLLDSRKQF